MIRTSDYECVILQFQDNKWCNYTKHILFTEYSVYGVHYVYTIAGVMKRLQLWILSSSVDRTICMCCTVTVYREVCVCALAIFSWINIDFETALMKTFISIVILLRMWSCPIIGDAKVDWDKPLHLSLASLSATLGRLQTVRDSVCKRTHSNWLQ